MKRRRIVAFAILASLLVVAAVPASATTKLVVASNSNTDADFNNADLLENLTVKDSGSAAYVDLPVDPSTLVDDFEDGDTTVKASEWSGWAGDTGSLTAQQSVVLSGSWSAEMSNTDSLDEVHATRSAFQPTNASALMRADSQSGSGFDSMRFRLQSSDSNVARVLFQYDGNIQSSGSSVGFWNADTTYEVTIFNIDYGSNEYDLEIINQSDGSTTASETNLAFSNAAGDVDEIGIINDNNNDAGDPKVFFDEVSVEEPVEDTGQYTGQNHTVEHAEQANINVSVTNGAVDGNVEFWDGSSWQSAASFNFTTTANHTVDISGHPDRTKWQVNATFKNLSGATTVELHDESILFTGESPIVDNASASPTGDLQQFSQTLSVQVNDTDFQLAQGDSVSVTFHTNRSGQVGTDTLTSNGTASTSHTFSTGGTTHWWIETTDDYALSQRSANFSVNVPEQILIFNETSPSQQINTATVTLQFFGTDGTVVERTTNSGAIDMTGLPVDEEFTVVAEADEFYTRRVYLDTIYDQSEIYLLNSTTSAADSIVFVLEDNTDEFPPDETTLRVEKPIKKDFDGDGSDETRFQTIAGDRFGASGEFPVELDPNTRYRLKVENAEGQVRTLGSYTTSGDAREILTIGKITFQKQRESGVSFQTTLVNSTGNRYVKFAYNDPENETNELLVEIVRFDDNSIVLKSNTTIAGPFGTYSETVQVPASAPDNVTYQVRWHANRNTVDDGGTAIVGDVPQIARGLNIDPTVLAYASYVGIVALTGLVVIWDDALAAAIAVLSATVLTLLGAISVPPLALGIGGTIAVLYNVGRAR